MPLWVPPSLSGSLIGSFDKFGSFSEALTITAGSAAHTKGAWIEVMASLPRDAYGIAVCGGITGANGANRAALMDIGIGSAGSENVIFPNLQVGCVIAAQSRRPVIPLFLPRGSRVAVRVQSATASATGPVYIQFLYTPMFPYVPRKWVSYGTDTSASTGFRIPSTAWGSGAFGTWTSVAVTNTRHNCLIATVDLNTTGISGYRVRLQYGVRPQGSSWTAKVIHELIFTTNTSEQLEMRCIEVPIFCSLPPQTEILVSGGVQSGAAVPSSNAITTSIYGG